MLAKLIKYEWKATRRVLLPLILAILLITALGCALLCTGLFASDSSALLAALLLIAYILTLVAFETVSTIYLLVHFYRSLYTKEGYLMFTLPVTPMQLLHSKLLVSFLWYLANALLTVLSVTALSFCFGYRVASGKLQWAADFFMDGRKDSFQDMFGFTPVQFVLLLLALLLIGCFASVTMGYASILLGQLVEKYKAACSIGFYIACSIVMQTVSSLVTAVTVPNYFYTASPDAAAPTVFSIFRLFSVTTLTSLAFGLVFYLITVILMRRGVNLD